MQIEGACTGQIDQGLLVLLGIARNDNRAVADRLLDKLLAYRVFSDEAGRMNLSVTDVGGGILLVSQFTLAADTCSGLRPGFSAAMPPPAAEELYGYVVQQLTSRHTPVACGVFGAHMQVNLTNDGPVTFLLEVE